jgi:hypothetical protein
VSEWKRPALLCACAATMPRPRVTSVAATRPSMPPACACPPPPPSSACWHVGADDFTPLLILTVIRACTPQLASNLAYVERFRYHSKLASETHYYYIQLVGEGARQGRGCCPTRTCRHRYSMHACAAC